VTPPDGDPDTDHADTGIRLVTRGDDAGLARSANAGIREAFEDGILRNASVMAPGPALGHAADELADLAGLCIGVHLTLTAEWDRPRWGPVSSPETVPSLVEDDGAFSHTAMALHERDASVREMVAEATAQIERVREAGFEPAYLDCHMGVDWVGDLANELDALREREGLLDGDGVGMLPAVGGAADDPDGLCARLDAAEPGTHLIVGHPCYDDAEMRDIVGAGHGPGEVATERDAQRRMFLDEGVHRCCEERGVEPVRFTDV
jgi:hypothetical protein